MPGHRFEVTIRATGFLLLAHSMLIGAQAQQIERATQCAPAQTVLMETAPFAPEGCGQAGFVVRPEIVPDTQSRRPGDWAARLRLPEKPIAPRKAASSKPFLALSAGVYAMALLDQVTTVEIPGWRYKEMDPLVKPFARVPTPVFIAEGAALATGANWLGWEMRRSRRWHKIWWLPQVCSIAGNIYGYEITKSNR